MITIALLLAPSARACPCECPTAQESDSVQTVIVTPIEPEPSPARQFVVVPLDPSATTSRGVVDVVAGVMTPDFVTHRAFDGKMVESAWLVPFTCEELDRVVNAVYARHGFFFLQSETRVSFLHFDLRYQPDMNLRVGQVEATFTSQDQLTLLRVETTQENNGCSSE